ncbi:hypothetical protein [Methanomethylovorans sp.]
MGNVTGRTSKFPITGGVGVYANKIKSINLFCNYIDCFDTDCRNRLS